MNKQIEKYVRIKNSLNIFPYLFNKPSTILPDIFTNILRQHIPW